MFTEYYIYYGWGGGMTEQQQLQLFDYKPPELVVPFPCRNRVSKIRRVGYVLFTRHVTEKGATAYWSRIVDDLARPMQKAGIPQGRIDQEIAAFETEVNREISRLELAASQSPAS